MNSYKLVDVSQTNKVGAKAILWLWHLLGFCRYATIFIHVWKPLNKIFMFGPTEFS
jgi:hypothetical protein